MSENLRPFQSTDCYVEQLLELFSRKKGVLARELDPRGNMVLNKPSQWVARGWDYVLIVSVANVSSLCSRKFALFEGVTARTKRERARAVSFYSSKMEGGSHFQSHASSYHGI